ncbi:MAG: Asp-tRNA(Asn)/Glu-tRNA(Gln) amidotransferase subunit GatC [Candidatus Omnitrophica bacterium]|nr:Asp-tRNA(Asn)/Glu-tRNA(Gln) amidotransferase subunit GatC [Candidatus Omnitrophota bacterium]MBI5144139.1 Asp-tRNA(Asn)/Glu-tRNA(Gln) amidotransferase subunit GatC [Candidatus Omnitrophota bacterium]
MKMIDEALVKHVALLSRLALDESELKRYSRQLASILSYINKLNEIDTSDVPPTSHVLSSLQNVDRPDERKRSLEVKDVLANAPNSDGDFFKIPKVIEGK